MSKASVTVGKTSDYSLKLRVYPNAFEQDWMKMCMKARQWAYNFGPRIYRTALRDYLECLKADPSCFSMMSSHRPKRLSSTHVSQKITIYLNKVRKAVQELVLQETQHSSTENPNLKDRWLLDVPRSVLTQGVLDYGKALTAKFEDLKKPKRNRLNVGWPLSRLIFDCTGFKIQLERPATSKHLAALWAQNLIPLGPAKLPFKSQGGLVYRDDLALPQKIPSIMSFSVDSADRWFASFSLSCHTPKVYQNTKRHHREDIKAQNKRKIQDLLQDHHNQRSVGYDPNFAALVTQDSSGLGLRITNPRQRREDKSRQSLLAQRCSKTQQSKRGGFDKHTQTRTSYSPASNRAKKALLQANRHKQHSSDITIDYQKKVAGIMGLFYKQHHFEGTPLKRMVKSKRRGNAFHLADVSPGRQVDLIKMAAIKHHDKPLFVTCASNFSSSQTCCWCQTKNPQTKSGIQKWTCTGCGFLHDRDECAGTNMLNEGYRIYQNDLNACEGVGIHPSRGLLLTPPPGGRIGANQRENACYGSFEMNILNAFEKLVFLSRREFCQHKRSVPSR